MLALKGFVKCPKCRKTLTVVLDVYNNEHKLTGDCKKQHIERITILNNKITKARELLLSDDIEPADFRAVRIEAEREIQVLERKISELRTNYMSAGEVEKVLDTALDKRCKLDALYCHSDHYAKRKLIGSIYPEKFTFEDLKVRTAKHYEAFRFIYMINNKLNGK